MQKNFQDKFKGQIQTIGKSGIAGTMSMQMGNSMNVPYNANPTRNTNITPNVNSGEDPLANWAEIYKQDKEQTKGGKAPKIGGTKTGNQILNSGEWIMMKNNMNNNKVNNITSNNMKSQAKSPNKPQNTQGQIPQPQTKLMMNQNTNQNQMVNNPYQMQQMQNQQMMGINPYQYQMMQMNPMMGMGMPMPMQQYQPQIPQYQPQMPQYQPQMPQYQQHMQPNQLQKPPQLPSSSPNKHDISKDNNNIMNYNQSNRSHTPILDYKPYTLKDYKELTRTGVILGSLGANIGTDEWSQKKDKMKRMEQYSNRINQTHQGIKKLKKETPKDEIEKTLKKNLEDSHRYKTYEYGKWIRPFRPNGNNKELPAYKDLGIINENEEMKIRQELNEESAYNNQGYIPWAKQQEQDYLMNNVGKSSSIGGSNNNDNWDQWLQQREEYKAKIKDIKDSWLS